MSRPVTVHGFDRFKAQEPTRRSGEKGCRCGRTRCLKQYCACFRNDERCSADCVCSDCANDGAHEDERMMAVRAIRLNSKDAFSGTSLEIGEQTVTTPRGSTKTVRGCRCKKSNCAKKYCECFGAGLKCGENCICEGCLNGNSGSGSDSKSKKSKTVSTKSKSTSKPTSKPSETKPRATHPPVLDKPQFKQEPAVAAVSQSVSKPLSRKPPLSVQIPRPNYQPTNAAEQQSLSLLCREQSLAWGMTPLGASTTPGWDTARASSIPMPSASFDRENFGLTTPTVFGRETSGLERETYSVWQSSPLSAREDMAVSTLTSMRSPVRLGEAGRLGKAACTAEILPPMSARSPRRALRPFSATQAQPAVLSSPSMAIFSAAEGMLQPSPSAALRCQSGLSTLGMHDDFMGRQISGLGI
jgi:hypothetical protein